jgi:D-alanyl-D-alanine carboxypeptidase
MRKTMQNKFDIHNSKVEDKRRKMKPRTFLLVFLVVIVSAGIAFIVWRLTRPTFSNATQELEFLVTDTVRNNKQIKNCALYVTKGDGSFTWAGAAGIASQAGQVPMTKDTPIYLASVTKIYTAVAIMKLYEQGALRLDDPMTKYLSQDLVGGIHVYQGHDFSNEITIEQLLAHTSGIPDYYDEKGKDGKTLFEIFKADQQRQWTVEQQIARARDELTPAFKPGEKAFYSDTNYQLLGKIIEASTGKPLQLVFDEFFFEPLDLKHTWLVGLSSPREKSTAAAAEVFSKDENITKMRSSTFYWADGGIVATTEDAVMFLRALIEGRIIKPATLELMHHWNPIQNTGPFQYGYGTMEFKLPSVISWAVNVLPVWGHTGSLGSFLYYSPGQDLYVAGTIDQTDDNATALLLMIKAMQAVAHAKKS